MKWLRSALLQLDSVSSDTALQVVKQAIRSNTQFFDSFSLQLLRSNYIYKFMALLSKDYCLVPDNGNKNLFD